MDVSALLKSHFSRFEFTCTCIRILSIFKSCSHLLGQDILPWSSATSLAGNRERDQRAIVFGLRSDLVYVGGLPLSVCIPFCSPRLSLWLYRPLLYWPRTWFLLRWPSSNRQDFNFLGSYPSVLSRCNVAHILAWKWKIMECKMYPVYMPWSNISHSKICGKL